MMRRIVVRLYFLALQAPFLLAPVRNCFLLFCVWTRASKLLRTFSVVLEMREQVELCWPYSRGLSGYLKRRLEKKGFDGVAFFALCYATPSRFLLDTFKAHRDAIIRDQSCTAMLVRKGLETTWVYDSAEIAHTQADIYGWTIDTVLEQAQGGKREVLDFMRWFAGQPPLAPGAQLKHMAESYRTLERMADTLDVPAFTAPAAASDGKLRVGLFRYDYSPHGEVDLLRGLLAGLPSDISFSFLGMGDAPASITDNYAYVKLDGDVGTAIVQARALAFDVVLFSPPLWGSFLTPMNRFIAHRIATTQIYYLGDILTSGMPTLDYLLFPEDVPLPTHQKAYTETLLPVVWGMPPLPPFFNTFTQASMEAPGGVVTYVTNCHIFKLSGSLLRAWADIIRQVPGSRILLCPYVNDGHRRYAPVLKRMIRKICAEKKIDPRAFVICDIAGLPAVRAQLATGQVYLDSFPYTGCFSTAESLRIGLPSVCLARDDSYHAQLARMTARSVGLEAEVITTTVEDYISRAVELGLSMEARQQSADRIRAACDALPLEQMNHDFSVVFWNKVREVTRTRLSTAA